MHKKSIEAAETLNSSDEGLLPDDNKEADELKSESIALLRAKAEKYNAKLREDFGGQTMDNKDSINPSFRPAQNNNNSSLHKFENLAHIADSIDKSCVGNIDLHSIVNQS